MGVEELLGTHELGLRLCFFAGALTVLALWEQMAPRRTLVIPKVRRWSANFAVLALNTVLLRVLFPTAAVGVALWAQQHQLGLFNWLGVDSWWPVICSVLILDMTLYFQHRLLHAVPWFWRIHRMHHIDLDFDVSTGGRFHPLEIVLSMLFKFAVIIALGAPAVAVIVFEIVLSTASLFNHSNIFLPRKLDACVRWFLVTPDMHRVHHSIEPDETNSNFGFSVPWWDKLFATYRREPRAGHVEMEIGVSEFRDQRQCQGLVGMLGVPFRG